MLRRQIDRSRRRRQEVCHNESDLIQSYEKTSPRKKKKNENSRYYELDKLVLGTGDDLVEKLQPVKTVKTKRKPIKDITGIDIDSSKKKRVPVWKDPDDQSRINDSADGEVKVVKNDLVAKFDKIYGGSAWSTLDIEQQPKLSRKKNKEEDILRRAGDLLDISKSEYLSKGIIEIERRKDLNQQSKNEGTIICAVEFHPSATVALVAGKAGILTLFQVDGETNPKIQSVLFKKFPIHNAHFTVTGEQVVVGSEEFGHFNYYDMIAGKICKVPWRKDMNQRNMGQFVISPDNKFIAFRGTYGQIHLFTANTKEWIGTLKGNNHVDAFTFNKDGSVLYTCGAGGEVYVWDMKTRQCVHKFYDDGCVNGKAIGVSPNGQYLACGSDAGVVNVYDASHLQSSAPKPIKAILNLTTCIHDIKINHSSELMSISSDIKNDAVRLVHLSSMTVYSNFPELYQHISRPLCVDFSLNSGYYSIANNKGMAKLYRLKHYKNY